MLLVGTVKAKELCELLENYHENDTNFQIVNQEGMNVTVSHNLENDTVAKALVRQLVKSDPKLKSFFLSVKIVDENGRLL